MSVTEQHKKLERNVTLLGVAALVAVAIRRPAAPASSHSLRSPSP
jgi:hypothetical protein